MDSKVMRALTISSVMPLPAADRISARLNPKVQEPRAGRAARLIAQMAAPMAPASLSMCPASASRATEPAVIAAVTSATMKPPIRASATAR